MSQIKAIETQYKGYRFRSRLEARYAVLFDTMEIKYEYEKEGYEIEGIRYLPDFWIPQEKCWFEVKGVEPTEQDMEKAVAVCRGTKRDLYIAVGDLGSEGYHYRFQYRWLHPEDAEHMKKNPSNFGGMDNVNKIIERQFAIYHLQVHSWEIMAALGLDPTFTSTYIKIMRSARFEHGESGAVL